jgi:hypothetical protein
MAQFTLAVPPFVKLRTALADSPEADTLWEALIDLG